MVPSSPKKSIGICKFCHNEFEYWTYRNQVFCNNLCKSRYGARQPKPNKKSQPYVSLECVTCGKVFSVHPAQTTKAYPTRYCSQACKHRYISATYRGRNNPNWIGGTKFPNRGPNWSKQRKAALKRDGRRCQICGKRPRRKRGLSVHHIRPYRLFNGNWLAANQLINLITLCRRCHADAENGRIACPLPMF